MYSDFQSIYGEAFRLFIANVDVIVILGAFTLGLGILATALHLWKYKQDG